MKQIVKTRLTPLFEVNCHIGAIVLFLGQNQDKKIDHTTLAHHIQVSKNNLSNIIDRIERCDVVRTIKSGSNKYYFLTSQGFDAYEVLNDDPQLLKVAEDQLLPFVKENKNNYSSQHVQRYARAYACKKR